MRYPIASLARRFCLEAFDRQAGNEKTNGKEEDFYQLITTMIAITRTSSLRGTRDKEFDFGFSDHSTDISINSTDTAAIKRALSAKINDATYFLCIVGRKTHSSKWVAWEIEKAVELKKKLVAVKTESQNTTPSGLLNVGAKWAMSFTFDSIKKATDSA